MTFTKTLIATALMASAGLAQASTFDGTDFVLSVIDFTNSSSYSIDTGVVASQANYASLQNFAISGSSDSNFAAFTSGVSAGDNVEYRLEAAASGLSPLYTSFTTSPVGAFSNQYAAASAQEVFGEMGYLPGAVGTGPANTAYFPAGSTAGPVIYGTNAGAQELSFSNSAAPGISMEEWMMSASKRTGVSYVDLGALNFTLSGTGTSAAGMITENVVSAVPLPATAWMFLSGVMGLLSFNRRKHRAV